MSDFQKTLIIKVEAASDIHGGHLSVSPSGGHLSVPLSVWALQALAIRSGANGLYPLIGTPVVLLVVLGRPGLTDDQVLLGTTRVPLVTWGARWLLPCWLANSL